jgi:hypothetical protein
MVHSTRPEPFGSELKAELLMAEGNAADDVSMVDQDVCIGVDTGGRIH